MTTRAELRAAREREAAAAGLGDAHELIDEQFESWLLEAGHAVLPELHRLHNGLPTLKSAMVCTGDGLNLCALGVDEQQVGRLAAMASSIHAVSAAAARGTLDAGGAKLKAVTVITDDAHAVVIAVPHPRFDHLLLWVAAGAQDRLGALLVHGRAAAERVRAVLPPL